MRNRAAGLLGTALLAGLTSCVTSGDLEQPPAALWTAPDPPQDAAWLRIEPGPALVVGIGQRATLRLRGRGARDAHCLWGDEGHGKGTLRVHSPTAPGVVDVRCRSGAHAAAAQITFTDAVERPFEDPYAGGALLLKLRKEPRGLSATAGSAELGIRSLDRLLERLGAQALPAFPFDRSGTRDSIGLAGWVAVVLPPGLNTYQAIALLRSDPNVHPESYLPVPLAEPAAAPVQLTPLGVAGSRDLGMTRLPPLADPRGHIPGLGIGIAVIAGDLDPADSAIAHRVRTKPWESDARDADGNGLPGDASGADFRRLLIDRSTAVPRLALAPAAEPAGEAGTRLARIALEAAPGSWLLPVRTRDDPWSLALGVVYAAAEGARVLACDWPAQPPHWILRDALAYAQQNCALPVCAADSLPADWAEPGGSVLDAWSGETRTAFFTRPLEASWPDRHPGPAAGAAAVALSRRPDLGPEAVSDSLRSADPVTSVASQPRGACREAEHEARGERPPFWKRTRISGGYERSEGGGLSLPPGPDDPANPDAAAP